MLSRQARGASVSRAVQTTAINTSGPNRFDISELAQESSVEQYVPVCIDSSLEELLPEGDERCWLERDK